MLISKLSISCDSKKCDFTFFHNNIIQQIDIEHFL